MNNKKVIVCDLDGTLAPSKSPISSDMAEILRLILLRHQLVVVSGGAFPQFQKQFLSELKGTPEELKNLFLFPTMGSTCYIYDKNTNKWKMLYEELLLKKEKDKIMKALKDAIKDLGFNAKSSYGEIIEDRGSQITFSALGQSAPIELKKNWDPNQVKRTNMQKILKKKIPEFEIRMGGTTSIDITKKGLDKAYAIKKIKELLSVSDEDMIFIGDALYKGGNDEAVKATDIDFIQESGPNETLEYLSRYI